MTDNTHAQPEGGQTVAEGNTAVQQQPAPRNDAEAAQQEAARSAQNPEPTEAEKAEAAKAEQEAQRKKNRTKAYIDRLNAENAEYRRKIAEIEARLPKPPEPKAPTLEQHNFDQEAFARAQQEYALQQARQQWEKEQITQAEARKQQEQLAAYQQRASAFAADHDDFVEVVGSIDPTLLNPELQAAILAHEKGPEIAYRLAQNEDELFSLASIRPELLERAVARFASRMSDAPSGAPGAAAAAAAAANPAIANQQPNKPITQAPAPPPRVSGRSTTEVPPEKLTDDEWYARDREKRRKR